MWLAFAVRSEYLNRDTAATLYKEYDEVLSMIVTMIRHPEKWIIDKK